MDTQHPLSGLDTFPARARLVGERIDTRALELGDRLATSPLTVRVDGQSLAVVFRYGAVVLFNVSPVDEAGFLHRLRPLVDQPFDTPEHEEIRLRIAPVEREGVSQDEIVLQDASVERIQLVADILAKSVLLDLYESRVASNFDRIEPLAAHLEQHGKAGQAGRGLLRHIGAVLLSEHKMVGRAEVVDKPDVLWDRPDLEALYHRLEDEFEIRERHAGVGRKLELISRTAHTLIQMQYEHRSLRLEWYIVVLIMVEIALFVYELFLV